MSARPAVKPLAPGEYVLGHERHGIRHNGAFRQAWCECTWSAIPRDRALNPAATPWCQDDIRRHLEEVLEKGGERYRPGVM